MLLSKTPPDPRSFSLPRETPGTASSSRKAASLSVMPSFFATNWMTLPAAPQAMQWKSPLPGVTTSEGSLSSWNGQRPFRSPREEGFNSMP